MHHFENKTRQGGSWSSPTGPSVSAGGRASWGGRGGEGRPLGGHAVPGPGPLGPINTSHSLEGGRARRVGPATAARGWGRGASGLHVSLHVQRQVVGAREGTVAQVALEGPVARVLAVVARELVRSRELPAAAFPVAVVGLLACRERARAGLSFPSVGDSRYSPRCLAATRVHPSYPLTSSQKCSRLLFEPVGILGTLSPTPRSLDPHSPGVRCHPVRCWCLEPRPQGAPKPASATVSDTASP